jgi:protein-disulfide isomerase
VGGAERNARKKRQAAQQAAAQRAVAAARKAKSDRTKVIITVAVVVVIAAAVITGVLITNSQKNQTEDTRIAAKSVSATYPVTRDGAVVVTGKDTAKVTLDLYEDFLCPICRQFEETYGPQIDQNVQNGTLKVRYHMLNLLNDRSDPEGYSLDSANAALCAADGGKFPAFYASLYGSQPEEGARGYDKNQLTKLGQDVGITSPDFAACVANSTYDQAVDQAFQAAKNDPNLQQDFGNGQRGFGTPTAAVDGKAIDTADQNWLNNLLGTSQTG